MVMSSSPYVEFLDGIMLSTRDIVPSCLRMLMSSLRDRKSHSSWTPRNIVTDLIAKGKVILRIPTSPSSEANVKRIQEGWEDTKNKATDRLQLLAETKNALLAMLSIGETIATDFETAEEE